MIPTISNPAVPSEILAPYNRDREPLVDYARGGANLYSAESGMNVQDWTAFVESETRIKVRSAAGEEALVYTASGAIEWLALAFDQAMHPVYCFAVKGLYYLRFWDVSTGQENQIDLGEIITPFARMDDVIRKFITHNDVIVTYIKTGGLYCRAERDRYRTEYLLVAGAFEKIKRFGMNIGRRLQWEME